MKESEIVRGYAQAVLGVAQGEGMLDQVERELTQFKEFLQKNHPFQEFLKDPAVAPEGKLKAMAEVLGETVSGATLNAMALPVLQGRGDLLLKIIEAFFGLAAASRKKVTALVTVAVSLSRETEEKLEKALSDLINEPVFLKISVDPSLLGGIVVRMGERIIDGSVRGQLLRLKEQISREILMEKGRSI